MPLNNASSSFFVFFRISLSSLGEPPLIVISKPPPEQPSFAGHTNMHATVPVHWLARLLTSSLSTNTKSESKFLILILTLACLSPNESYHVGIGVLLCKTVTMTLSVQKTYGLEYLPM